MPAAKPRVVIVGGGFGGLSAARALRGAPAQITLLDQRNHHVFQPLLYQVATAGLSAPEIAAPLRRILRRQSNVTVLMGKVVSVDVRRRVVVLEDGEIGYHYLILATGATHSYFGHDDWARYAPGLKSLEDALEIRRRLLTAFERAEREPDPAARTGWLTFVVVGAGPTGVELAGTVAEIARHTLARDFRRIDPARSRVVLLEGTERVLPPYPPDLSEKARRQLEGLGVEVRTGALVTEVDGHGVCIGPERIEARTVLWAAGVAASPLGRSLGAPMDRAGRVKVEKDLTLPEWREVFVVGDLAAFEQDGRLVPGVAPAAMQMGRHAAHNIRRSLAGQPHVPFRYVDKGSLATIGRKAAVADFGRLRFSGLLAWLAWIGVHVFFLIGFRNRFVVLFSWAWAYFTYQRSARLIVGGKGD
jgi:NADH:quinone reductase (non-electrogenic)